MNFKIKSLLSILLCIVLVCGVLAGCGKKEQTTDQQQQGQQQQQEQQKQQEQKQEEQKPAEPVKITYWAATSPETPEEDPENLACFKEVEEKLGVDIEWQHIPKDTESEQFQLMIATNNLPDVIFYEWLSYGPDTALDGEIIIPLDDIISKYAPNLSAYLEKNPDVARDMKSDSGHYYCFPYLRGNDMWDRLTNGLYMRKDWLDDLGLNPPETIEEWYTTLKAFKEQKGATIPFGIDFGRIGFITTAWGFNGTGFVVDNGKIIYPVIQPEFKEVLETLNKWIKEGLLLLDPKELKKEIVAGTCGAWQASPGSYVKEAKETNPNFEIIALQNPVLQKGDTPYIFPRWPYTGRGAAITTACDESKYEAIARWLDYAYSEEGYIWDNFGKEGVHYNWVDGKIMPTDIVYNPPEGLTTGQFNRRNFRPKNAPGPYMTGDTHKYLHEDALAKDSNYPYKKQAMEAWGNGDPSRTLPSLTLTSEEKAQLENYSQMWSYVGDMVRKFINGEEPLDNFDKFVEEAKRLGAEEVVKIYQGALDRYLNR